MAKGKFEGVVVGSLSERQISLIFDNEADAADFRIWWDRSGSASFRGWKERGDEMYRTAHKREPIQRCNNCRAPTIGTYCEECKGKV